MAVPGTVSMDMATPQRGALDHRDDGHAGEQLSQTMITHDQIVHKRWFEGQMTADMLDLAGFVNLTTRAGPDWLSGLWSLDQFETVLTLDPLDQAAKEEFFLQLGMLHGREAVRRQADTYLMPSASRAGAASWARA